MTEPAESPSTTPRHPIAVVSERTGLSQDILRMWERRYGAVRPARTDAGERLYSDADVERLRLLTLAAAGGRRIGNIARFDTAGLARLVAEDAASQARHSAVRSPTADIEITAIDQMLARVRALDGRGLDELMRRTAARLGASTFVESTATALLRRIGDDWHAGHLSIAHEHLASAVVSEFVAELMRSMAGSDGSPRLVVGTPAGSRHTIGATLVGARAAAEGWDVLFLGGDLPSDDIVGAAISSGADALALSVVYTDDPAGTVEELRSIKDRLRGTPLLVGGHAAAPMARELSQLGIHFVETLAGLRHALARVSPRRENRTAGARYT